MFHPFIISPIIGTLIKVTPFKNDSPRGDPAHLIDLTGPPFTGAPDDLPRRRASGIGSRWSDLDVELWSRSISATMGTHCHVSFIFRGFRGYNPYIGGLKPSFFMGAWGPRVRKIRRIKNLGREVKIPWELWWWWSRWWQLKYLLFSHLFGEDSQFD